jgi:hypothetical protein
VAGGALVWAGALSPLSVADAPPPPAASRYAASSWALARGKATYFHDLLNIDSVEAQLIKDMDKLYSKGSRLATEMGGVVERMWGNMSAKQGDENSLRIFYAMAEQIKPLLLSVPALVERAVHPAGRPRPLCSPGAA